MQLIVLQYNNYLNRIIKHEDEIADYYDKAANSFIVNDYDFNPNDGVDTTAILGGEFYDYENSDYLIVIDQGEIASRWFIIDARRTRRGQYSLTLHRDVCTDSLEDVINAPCFIEKAIPALNSKFVFNSENMTYNQIKQKEILLKDKTNIPWMVFYLKQKRDSAVTLTLDLNQDVYDEIAHTDYDEWAYIGYTTTAFEAYPKYAKFEAHSSNVDYTFDNTGILKQVYAQRSENIFSASRAMGTQKLVNSVYVPNISNLVGTLDVTTKQYTDAFIQRFKGTKIWKFDDCYKRITLEKVQEKTESGTAPQALLDEFTNLTTDAGGTVKGNPYSYTITYETYKLKAEDYTPAGGATIEIPNNTKKPITSDAAYDILTVPYGSFELSSGGTTYFVDGEMYAQMLLQGFDLDEEIELLLDAQILPYCPHPQIRDGYLLGIGESWPIWIKEGTAKMCPAFWCPKASFSFDIAVTDTDLQPKSDVVEKKVQSETQFIRLNSPNYASSFQMGVAQNGGVSNIEVSCTYKPISPYIHLNPTWGELYGTTDFNDARGLICAGEFSTDRVTKPWIEYQRNNKNYQASFDRQIQNMEVKNKYGHIQDMIGAAAGTGIGAIAGASFGGIAGGIAGGVASAGAGIADVAINQKLRAEEMSYAKDQFGYQLGNIQALPQTLSRTTSYNIDNKYFPFIEIYDASDEEKEALRNKITYNGMTIGAISTISNFMKDEPTYIKGQIIRLENLGDDYHYARTIVDEINKGVYI